MLQDVMANATLVKELADVAKDTALLHGVQMRLHESPNSSEVKTKALFMLKCTEGKSSKRLKLGWGVGGGVWSPSLPSGKGWVPHGGVADSSPTEDSLLILATEGFIVM